MDFIVVIKSDAGGQQWTNLVVMTTPSLLISQGHPIPLWDQHNRGSQNHTLIKASFGLMGQDIVPLIDLFNIWIIRTGFKLSQVNQILDQACLIK